MEPGIKKYFWKIVYSLFWGLVWLFVNVMAGIYYGYGLMGKTFTVANLLYFVWFLGSLAALLWYYYRVWK